MLRQGNHIVILRAYHHSAAADAAGGQKRPASRVGQIGPPGAFQRSPDGPASRVTPRLPGRSDFVPMKWVNI